MKTKLDLKLVCFGLLPSAFCLSLRAQGTAFTYQGRLNDGANPAAGIYDLRFTIYDSTNLPGTIVAGPLTNSATGLSNGLFTVALDFGAGVFDGSARWLDIGVRTNGPGAFIPLSSRQKLTATPYAITAGNLASGGLAAGTYGSAVTFNNSANSFNGSYAGNGGGLTNVNAATLGGLASSNFWKLGGNTTNPFPTLGTIDAQPLSILAGSHRALQIETVIRPLFIGTLTAPNLLGGSEFNVISNGVVGATIAGGGAFSTAITTFKSPNIILDDFGTIGGGGNNTVGNGNSDFTDASAATVAGGEGNLVAASHASIGGGSNNVIQIASTASVIAGGQGNLIQTNSIDATIAGGQANLVRSSLAAIGGGSNNSIQAVSTASLISGGQRNGIRAGSSDATIAGGEQNLIGTNAGAATIVGGVLNQIQDGAGSSTIGGGWGNLVRSGAFYSTVGGGFGNTASGSGAFVGGGGVGLYYLSSGNEASGQSSVVVGGADNTASGDYAFVGGGGAYGLDLIPNLASGPASVIGGGLGNWATNVVATVAGGAYNHALGQNSFIGGGSSDSAAGFSSAILGGFQNVIDVGADYSAIGGGSLNAVQLSSTYCVIGGGQFNTVVFGTTGSTIGGGWSNTNNSLYGTIGGGANNTVFSLLAPTVGGGAENTSSGDYATVAGGTFNTSSSTASTVGGGNGNISSGYATTVGGGYNNLSSSNYTTVPGGYRNSALGDYSFAAGNRAKANHQGSFVWADSQFSDFASTANDQFNIRAAGGIRLNTDTSLFFGNQTRQMVNLFGTQYGIGVQAATTYFRSGSDFSWFQNGVHNDGTHNPGAGGTEMMRLDGAGNLSVRGIVATNVVLSSDRTMKERFNPIDARDVLDKVTLLPISRWNFKGDQNTRHIGPMAQDFYSAFEVGTDDKHIAVVDEGGVALAAIQGLNQKLEEQGAELKQKETEIKELNRRLDALERIIQQTH